MKAALILALMILGLPIAAVVALAQDVDPDSAIVQDFEKRVNAYVHLRSTVESKLPTLKETASPEKISHYQEQLGAAIRENRKAAQPGEIFTPRIAGEFRRLIGLAMQSGGKRIATSLHHAEPVQLHLRVNDSYPAHIPLQSTPPSLLANLPVLPQQMEYRITGTDLVLLDVRANLVIDILQNIFA